MHAGTGREKGSDVREDQEDAEEGLDGLCMSNQNNNGCFQTGIIETHHSSS